MLLCVLILGIFPFDVPEDADPTTKESQMDIWCVLYMCCADSHVVCRVQQMTRKWNELPQLAKALRNVRCIQYTYILMRAYHLQLSPECLDLLNRIFVVDHAQRITVEEIRAHPWYLKPLSPKFQAAWDSLQSRQAQFEAKLRARTMDRVRWCWHRDGTSLHHTGVVAKAQQGSGAAGGGGCGGARRSGRGCAHAHRPACRHSACA